MEKVLTSLRERLRDLFSNLSVYIHVTFSFFFLSQKLFFVGISSDAVRRGWCDKYFVILVIHNILNFNRIGWLDRQDLRGFYPSTFIRIYNRNAGFSQASIDRYEIDIGFYGDTLIHG